MRPMPAKSEEYIADALEAWEREEMELGKIGPSNDALPDAWMGTAVKCLMIGTLTEHVERNSAMITEYDELSKDIMRCAMQKRLERARKGHPTGGYAPMDTHNVGGPEGWGGMTGQEQTEQWQWGNGQG